MTDGDTLQERLINAVYGGKNYWNTELFGFIAEDLLNAVQTSFRQILTNADITYMASDDAFSLALEQNIFHFPLPRPWPNSRPSMMRYAKAEAMTNSQKKRKASATLSTAGGRRQNMKQPSSLREAASDYRRLMKKA